MILSRRQVSENLISDSICGIYEFGVLAVWAIPLYFGIMPNIFNTREYRY
jgi:hypothetical protein